MLGAVQSRSMSSSAIYGGLRGDQHTTSLNKSEASDTVGIVASSYTPHAWRQTATKQDVAYTYIGLASRRSARPPHMRSQRPSIRSYATSPSEQINEKEDRAPVELASINFDKDSSREPVYVRRGLREAERQLMEQNLAQYTYTSPAGTIAGMRKTEQAITLERSALQLALGTGGKDEHVAVARFIVPTLHMLDSIDDANVLLKQIRSGEMLSFDMEWVSSPTTRMPYKTSLVQIATMKDIFVLQLGRMKGVPSELSRILNDQSILKCGVAIHGDANKFRQDYDVDMRGCLELSSLAKVVDNERWTERQWAMIGLRDLCRIYLDRRLAKSKKIQVSRWDRVKLKDEQIHYAASDAYVGLEIVHALCTIANAGHAALTSYSRAFLMPNFVAALNAVIGRHNTEIFIEAAEVRANEDVGDQGDKVTAASSTLSSENESVVGTTQPSTTASSRRSQSPSVFGPFFGKPDVVETVSEEYADGLDDIAECELVAPEKQELFSRSVQKRLRVAAQNELESSIARAATQEFSFGNMRRTERAQRLAPTPEGQATKRTARPSWADFNPEEFEAGSSSRGPK